MDRPKMWSKSLRIIGDHPYFGVTLGNFEYSTYKYRFPVENTVGRYAKIFKDPHNSYLEIGAELGVLGVICILSILSLLIRCCMRTYRKVESEDEKHDLIVSFLILIGLAVQGFFHDVTHSPPNILLGLVALASVGYYHGNHFEKELGNSRGLIPAAFLEKYRIKRTFLIFVVLVWVVICWPAFCLKAFVSHNYYQSAMTVYGMGNLPEAAKNLKKAMYYNPMQPFYFRLMGDIHMQTYERTGELETLRAAEKAFSKSINLNRVNPSFYFTMGNYYYFIKETSREDTFFAAKAVQEFKKAIELSPYDIKYRMRLVSLYLSIGKNHEALRELEECVKLEPNFVTGRHFLSLLYGKMGDNDRSKEMRESIHAIREKYRHYVPTKEYEALILMDPEEYAQRRFKVPLHVEEM
jgi:tetratricopeptide (TPR) repeat protein